MKPIIRTITFFLDIKEVDKLTSAIEKLDKLKEILINSGYEIQTARLTTNIGENLNPENINSYEESLKKLEDLKDFYIYHLGPISNTSIWEGKEESLVELFLDHPKAFLTIEPTSEEQMEESSLFAAKLCKMIANNNPFECRRFAYIANVPSSTPFYPASKVLNNGGKFGIGLQSANLANSIEFNASRKEYENNLRKVLEEETKKIEDLIPDDLKNDFIGFDTSLAPFPTDEHSIVKAIEKVLKQPFGSSGTLSVVRLFTRVMQENNIYKTGLCGLMLPPVEENLLSKRAMEGMFTLRDLLFFSSVCATGLDTVVISDQETTEKIASLYIDLATLAFKLNKPLSARLFIEKKNIGETVKYDWEFACETPVFKI